MDKLVIKSFDIEQTQAFNNLINLFKTLLGYIIIFETNQSYKIIKDQLIFLKQFDKNYKINYNIEKISTYSINLKFEFEIIDKNKKIKRISRIDTFILHMLNEEALKLYLDFFRNNLLVYNNPLKEEIDIITYLIQRINKLSNLIIDKDYREIRELPNISTDLISPDVKLAVIYSKYVSNIDKTIADQLEHLSKYKVNYEDLFPSYMGGKYTKVDNTFPFNYFDVMELLYFKYLIDLDTAYQLIDKRILGLLSENHLRIKENTLFNLYSQFKLTPLSKISLIKNPKQLDFFDNDYLFNERILSIILMGYRFVSFHDVFIFNIMANTKINTFREEFMEAISLFDIDQELITLFGIFITNFSIGIIKIKPLNKDKIELIIKMGSNLDIDLFEDSNYAPYYCSNIFIRREMTVLELNKSKKQIQEIYNYFSYVFSTYPLHSELIGSSDIYAYFDLYKSFPEMRKIQIPLIFSQRFDIKIEENPYLKEFFNDNNYRKFLVREYFEEYDNKIKEDSENLNYFFYHDESLKNKLGIGLGQPKSVDKLDKIENRFTKFDHLLNDKRYYEEVKEIAKEFNSIINETFRESISVLISLGKNFYYQLGYILENLFRKLGERLTIDNIGEYRIDIRNKILRNYDEEEYVQYLIIYPLYYKYFFDTFVPIHLGINLLITAENYDNEYYQIIIRKLNNDIITQGNLEIINSFFDEWMNDLDWNDWNKVIFDYDYETTDKTYIKLKFKYNKPFSLSKFEDFIYRDLIKFLEFMIDLNQSSSEEILKYVEKKYDQFFDVNNQGDSDYRFKKLESEIKKYYSVSRSYYSHINYDVIKNQIKELIGFRIF